MYVSVCPTSNFLAPSYATDIYIYIYIYIYNRRFFIFLFFFKCNTFLLMVISESDLFILKHTCLLSIRSSVVPIDYRGIPFLYGYEKTNNLRGL